MTLICNEGRQIVRNGTVEDIHHVERLWDVVERSPLEGQKFIFANNLLAVMKEADLEAIRHLVQAAFSEWDMPELRGRGRSATTRGHSRPPRSQSVNYFAAADEDVAYWSGEERPLPRRRSRGRSGGTWDGPEQGGASRRGFRPGA